MANQCLVLDPLFPCFAFQQQSASSFISRHRIISFLSPPQQGSTAFQRHRTRARVALEKIQKLSTFTDAEEGRKGWREGSELSFLSFLEKKGGDEEKKGKDYDNIIYKRRL